MGKRESRDLSRRLGEDNKTGLKKKKKKMMKKRSSEEGTCEAGETLMASKTSTFSREREACRKRNQQ